MNKTKHVLTLVITAALLVILMASTVFGAFGSSTGASGIKLGLDLAGGVSITYQAVEGSNPTSDQMEGALSVIQRRLDAKGYTEANAYLDGNDRIRVEIPGVEDASKAVEEIGRTALLRFVGIDWSAVVADTDLVSAYYDAYREAYKEAYSEENGGDMTNYTEPADDEVLSFFTSNPLETLNMVPDLLDAAIEKGYAEQILTGENVSDASFQKGQISSSGTIEPYVKLEFDSTGSQLFSEGTTKYLNKYIAIMLDDTVISIPTVQSTITDNSCIISNIPSEEEAKELASDIVGGALPVELEDIEHNSVGATLGQNALDSAIKAGIIGFILIMIFMIVVYRVPGLASALALMFYITIELLLINLFNITLTLPGIGGIILSVGMAVDANVIIFSRMGEEIRSGQSVRVATRNGFSKALSAILDGNITTLIAALVLYFFGTGSIKGFAETLGLGIVLSMFSALLITRLILIALEGLLPEKNGLYCRMKEGHFGKNLKVIERMKVWFAIPCVILIIGVISLIARGFNYDIDFAGGTLLQIDLHEDLDSLDELEKLVSDTTGDTNPQVQHVTGASGSTQVTIKVKELSTEEITTLYETIADKYGLDKEGKSDLIEQSSISPMISSEMKRSALLSTIIAGVLMLLYITLRFRDFAFGLAALLPLLHDVLIMICMYTLIQIPINNTFIVALLTIVGYSINNTIVVFDRIRENRRLMNKKKDMAALCDLSVQQTLSRSINTSLTTIITVLLLFLMGVQSLRWFALPILIGLIAGTYSSVLLASPFWYLLEKAFHK